MGDRVEPAKMISLPAGGFITASATMNHYVTMTGRTVVHVHSMGPFAVTDVDVANDSTKKGKTKVSGR